MEEPVIRITISRKEYHAELILSKEKQMNVRKELNTPTLGTLTTQQRKKQVKIAGALDVKKMNATVRHVSVVQRATYRT